MADMQIFQQGLHESLLEKREHDVVLRELAPVPQRCCFGEMRKVTARRVKTHSHIRRVSELVLCKSASQPVFYT